MRLRVAVIATSLVILLVGAPTVLSMPEYSFVETYYSDAQFQNQVGQYFVGCTGGWQWGTLSGYLNITIFLNCSSGQPDERGENNDLGEPCYNNMDDDEDGYIDCADPSCWPCYP